MLLMLFVILTMVVLCSRRGDKLLFIMNFCPLVHSMLCSSMECYVDAMLSKYS